MIILSEIIVLIRNRIDTTDSQNGNPLSDMFNLNILGWINDNNDKCLWVEAIERDMMMVFDVYGYRLLPYSITLRNINSDDTRQLNDSINNISINDSNSDVYNDLRTNINILTNVKAVYNVLELISIAKETIHRQSQ